MKLLKIASKRGLALLVTLMMCLSLLPGTAAAYNQNVISSGQVNYYPDSTPSDFANWQTATGKVRSNFSGVALRVGETGTFYSDRPVQTLKGTSCGHTIATYYAADYCQVEFFNNTGANGVIGEVEFAPSSTYGITASFEGTKPGKISDAVLAFYCNFGITVTNIYGQVISSGSVSCPTCGWNTTVYTDQKWYRYNDKFTITVNADYALNYDTQGGSSISSTTKTVADTSASFTVTNQHPSKQGYQFLGWSEDPSATTATYTGGEPITLNWESGDTVSKTLYAVWGEDTTDTTYVITREYYNGDTLEAEINRADNPNTKWLEGTVGEELVGQTLASEKPAWNKQSGLTYSFDHSNPTTLTLDETAANNVITLYYTHVHQEGANGMCTECGKCAHNHTGETECGHENCGNPHCKPIDTSCKHPNVKYVDNSDGTHKVVCANPECNAVVTERENHVDDADSNKICDKCGACLHSHTEKTHCDHDSAVCKNPLCSNTHVDEDHDGFCDTDKECTHTKGSDGHCTDPDCPHNSDCACGGKDNGGNTGTCDHPEKNYPHHCDHDSSVCGNLECKYGTEHKDGSDDDDKCDICGGEVPKDPGTTPTLPEHYDTDGDGKCDVEGCDKCLHPKDSNGHCIYGDKCPHDANCDCHPDKPQQPEPAETYTVTFCAHDGTFASGAHEVVETVAKSNDATVTVPANPTRAGYDFKGWGVTGVEANQTISVTGSVTYYAQWEKIPEQGEPELTVNHRIVNASKTVASGGVFTYQIIMQNTGTAPIENLMIQETLPPELRMDVTGANQTSNINVMATNSTVENELRVADYSENTNGQKYLRWRVSELGVNQSLIITFSAVATNNSDHDIQVNADLWYNYKGYTQPNRQLLSMSSKNAALYSDDGWGEWGVGGGNNTVTGTVTGSGDQPEHTHSYTSSVTTQPTCTTAGVRTYTCSCGDSYTEEISSLGHNMVSNNDAVEATCTAGGHTASSTCSRGCGHTEAGTPTGPLGHDLGEWHAISETQEQRECSRCDYLETRNVTPVDPGDDDNNNDDNNNPENPTDPTEPTPTPTPDPIPDEPTPTTPTPADGGEDIVDENPPLASGVLGLNLVDHFAYVQGDPDGKVRPKDYITRAEVASIFFRLMTEEYRTANWAVTNDFTDANAGDWYNAAISTAAKAGLITGDPEGTYRPDDYITHAEFVALAARFAVGLDGEGVGDFKDTEGHWAAPSIRLAAKAGWITWADNGYFLPEENITRAEVMAMINRMLDRAPDEEHLLPEMKTWVDNPKGTDYYADVQEATNDHLYERVEDSATESWTELAEVKTWSEKEAEWLANNGASAPEAAPETAE